LDDGKQEKWHSFQDANVDQVQKQVPMEKARHNNEVRHKESK